jgi:TonB-linked SusC/RagA family outer membrane protein
MRKSTLLVLLLFAALFGARAQDMKVTGKVTDAATGLPVESASVKVKGKTYGAITGANGSFSLTVDKSATLVISSIGYGSKEVKVADGNFEVALVKGDNTLGDVVVVGYGTQRKATLTGASVTLKTEDLTRRQVASTSNLLQGLAPGVTVQQQSGKPGADGAGIVIRGTSSISGSSAPLVIIDGLAAGSLDQIDPNTIETITILKDAASTSIYGNRASGGVILVKTKRGAKKGIQVSYNNFFTKQIATAIPKRVSAINHMELSNVAEKNRTGNAAAFVFPQVLIDKYKSTPANNLDVIDTDWLDLLLTNSGFLQNHNVQLSSGGEKVNMFTSVTYLRQQGLIPNSSFEKYDVRFNPEFKLNDKLTLSGNFSYNANKTTNPSTGSAEFIIRQAIGLPAIGGGKYGEGMYGTAAQSNNRNPLAMAEAAGTSVTNGNALVAKFGFNYKPIRGLDIEAYWGYSKSSPIVKTFVKNADIYQPNIATSSYDKIGVWPGTTSLGLTTRNDTYSNYTGQATYSFKIKEHSVKILAGAQAELYKNYFFGASRQGFINPNQPYLNLGSGTRDNNDGASENALAGFYARLNYSYKDKYLLELNGRRDGSSRFSQVKNKQWGTFGSVSAGWIFSSEKFFGNLNKIISFGKLRVSTGGNGNQNIGSNYGFDAFYSSSGYSNPNNGTNAYFNYATSLGLALLDFPNPDLSWETSKQTNVGIDLNFTNGLTVSADYYVRTQKDQLLRRTLPSSAGGLTNPFVNAGNMENRGWEIQLNYRKKIGQFGLDATVMLSDVKNKVQDLVAGTPFIGDGLRTLPGFAANSYFGYQAIGYFADSNDVKSSPVQFGSAWSPTTANGTKPGDVKYADLNGDGKIDAGDRAVLGNAFPRYEYSINLNLTYKNFDLNLFGQGVGKRNNYLSGTGAVPFASADFAASLLDIHKDYWTPGNPNATFPRLLPSGFGGNNYLLSSKWIKSAAYFRIKNVSLGYRLPAAWLTRAKIASVRVFVSGANLFTISKAWKGFDPEINNANAEFYPLMRTYTAGLNVNF